MIINCRTWGNLPDHGRSQRRRVFVDGREIHAVWYIDTEAGLVKTLDVYGDGRKRLGSHAIPEMVNDPDIEHVGDDTEPLSKTLRGKIELFPILD